MKKLCLLLLLILTPFFANSKISEWKKGQKSQIRIISDLQSVMLEISLFSGYKITDLSNCKINLTKKSNLKGLPALKLQETSSENQNHILIPIQINAEKLDHYSYFQANISFPVCKDDCILEEYSFVFKYNPSIEDIQAQAIIEQYNPTKAQSNRYNIFYIILISIIGGFILNLMPCVLPVLGIKLSLLTKDSTRAKRINIIATVLGITSSYLFIAIIIIFLKRIGIDHGFGFYFQNTDFIIFITIVLTLAASAILERIYIPIPQVINEMSISSAYKINSEVALSFLAGCFTTLMATPCTAPFVSTAIAFALQGSNLEIIIVFCMMGLGLSLPYILILITPRFIGLLPKSGAWMILFKKSMAAITYGAIFWFTYVVSHQLGNISALILIMLILLLKFSIELNVNKLLKTILTLIIIFALFTLPNLANVEQEKKETQLSEIWHEFNLSEIETQLDKGKIVIVDITASWCATCQLNKLIVLDSDYFINMAHQENIFAMRIDVTNDFPLHIKNFMNNKGYYAIPFTIIFGPSKPNGTVLSSILTPLDFNKAIMSVK